MNLLANLLLVLVAVAFIYRAGLAFEPSRRACMGICRDEAIATFSDYSVAADVLWESSAAAFLRMSLIDCLWLELVFASSEQSLIALTMEENSCWELTVLFKLVEADLKEK